MDLSNISGSLDNEQGVAFFLFSLALAVFLYHAQYYRIPTI
jgi:hypothetical protein